jgi:hypothetical protein
MRITTITTLTHPAATRENSLDQFREMSLRKEIGLGGTTSTARTTWRLD